MTCAVISLDGDWLLATDPGNIGREQNWQAEPAPGARSVHVPSIIQEFFPAYHGVAWYWREFTPPANPHPRGRTLLRFGAVDYLAEVWVNGIHVGGHEGGETPFVLDATDALNSTPSRAPALLAMRVLNPTNEPIDGIVLAHTPHRNKSVPHSVGGSYNSGGIVESVEMVLAPAVRLSDLYARPDVATGAIHVEATAINTLAQPVTATLRCLVAPAATGETLTEVSVPCALPVGESRVEADLRLDQPRLWQLHDPYLYRVTARLSSLYDQHPQALSGLPSPRLVQQPSPDLAIRLEQAGPQDSPHAASDPWPSDRKSIDERSARCGFRDFRVVDGYFRLNGKRIFVRSTHTGNHCPIGQVIPPVTAPDLLRRDLVYAKASGFNMVRFISGVAHPWQLDLCDEIGLMVYEESYAGWLLDDSPDMARRFDLSVREMVQRDRNHPSVAIWGMLNETFDSPTFRHAVATLPLVRSLDMDRLVLLSSGRWDGQPGIGSVSNPGSADWEHVWGVEAPGAPAVPKDWGGGYPGYLDRAGDAHVYPGVPHPASTIQFLRQLGRNTKPVFLSEYGIGSTLNAIRERRWYEQAGVNLDAEDAELMRSMAEHLAADWERFGLDGVYAFPEDMLRESQRLHARQRLIGFDAIRSNPKLCGYNLTGMLDHGMTGEGVWTFWREWKPGVMDAMSDGWAPLRWCLFAGPLHGYAGRPVKIEAVLANEDVLPPGDYPARLRVIGPEGVAWDRRVNVRIPASGVGQDAPLAVPVLAEEITLGQAGEYEFAATLERGGAPAGGHLRFRLSEAPQWQAAATSVTTWGITDPATAWLQAHDIACAAFDPGMAHTPLILVGDLSTIETTEAQWASLLRQVEAGATAIFLSPLAFKRGDDPVGWLPLANKGRCYAFNDWLYHKECVAKAHPLFAGLQARGIMDWDYYGPIIPRHLFADQDTPDEVMAAAFAVGYSCPGGYASGVLAGMLRRGAGRLVLNTLRILDNIGQHPAADRLLLNAIAL